MQKLFWGLLFVLLDFTYSFESGTIIGLLPDFIGFFLIYTGLKELAPESGRFAKAMPWSIGLAVYNAILYTMDVFAWNIELISWGLGVLNILAGLYVIFLISHGVQEMAEQNCFDLNGGKLVGVWIAMALSQILAAGLVWIPVASIFATFSTLITAIVYLVSFHQSKKLYVLMIS